MIRTAQDMARVREIYNDEVATGTGTRDITVMAVIALPNPASEALHRRLGFEHIGTLREVGVKFGRRIDTGWWQRFPP